MGRFIYVFQEEAMMALEKRKYRMIKHDERNGVWVYENPDINCFDIQLEYPFVLSNTLSF